MNGLEENKFDEILRSKLNGLQMEPPKDLMKGILQSIENTKPSGGFTFSKWGIVSVVLLLSLGGYFMFTSQKNMNSKNVSVQKNDQHVVINEKLNQPSDKTKPNNINLEEIGAAKVGANNSVLNEDSKIAKIDSEKESKFNTEKIVDKSDEIIQRENSLNSTNSNVVKTVDQVKKKGSQEPIDESTINEAQSSLHHQDEGTRIDASKRNSNIKGDSASNSDQDTTINLEAANFVLKPTVDFKKEAVVRSNSPRIFKNELTESANNSSVVNDAMNDSFVFEESLVVAEIDVLKIDKVVIPNHSWPSDLKVASTTLSSNPSASLNETLALDSNKFVFPNAKWSIDLLAGPSLSFRTFNVAGNEDLENHKNDSETSLVTYSYKANVKRAFSEKLRIHVGFMYLRMGENYSFSNAVASHSATNQYDYFSIPVGVDYKIFEKRKVEIFGGIGAQYNFLQKGSSSWLDPHSYSPQAHTNEGEASPFRDQTFAWNANVELRYRLYDRIDLILREEGILFQNSIYKKETGIDQREYSFETFLGFGYRF